MNITRNSVLPDKFFLSRTGVSAKCIGFLVSAVVLMSPAPAFPAVQCTTPDRSFEKFLQHFEESIEFQRSRVVVPMVARFGDYTATNVVIKLWDAKKLKNLDHPLILSSQGRMKEHIVESFPLSTKRYTEVFHDGPLESDLYRVLYKFRNIDGCWFFEEMHYKSL